MLCLPRSLQDRREVGGSSGWWMLGAGSEKALLLERCADSGEVIYMVSKTDEEIMVGCAHDGSYVAVSVVRQLMAKARQAERHKWTSGVGLKTNVELEDRIKALETEKEHLIKQVEQLKYGESAGFKYNHSHPYPLCQGCVTEGRDESKVCAEK